MVVVILKDIVCLSLTRFGRIGGLLVNREGF